MSVYQFTVKDWQGQLVSLDAYQGKLLLIVNTATHCGFTPQYSGLQELYDKYAEQGFEILDFPCNQFGAQAQGTGEEIQSFCAINYGTAFPRFEKVEVNGKNAAPLFQYLKEQLPGVMGKEIKWNFTKFLIGRDGTPLKRYAPTTEPKDIAQDIENNL